MTNKTQEYNFEIPGDILLKAIKCSNDEFQKKLQYFESYGIKRLTPVEINKLHNCLIEHWIGEPKMTFVESAIIQPNKDEYLEISNIKKFSPLVFKDCKFPRTSLSGLKSNYTEIITVSYNNLFCIKCYFEHLMITESDFIGLEFKSVKLNNLYISNNSNIDDIFFENCAFNDSIFVHRKCSISNLYLQNSTLNSIIIESSNMASLGFKDVNLSHGIFRSGSSLTQGKLKESFIKSFKFEERSSADNLDFEQSSINKFTISNSEINSIDGQNDFKVSYLEFYNCTLKTVLFNKIECDIHLTKATFSELYISNSNLGLLNIGPNCEFNIYVIDSQIAYLLLKKTTITPSSSISFSEVSFFASLVEETDILGRAHFRKIKGYTKDKFEPSDYPIENFSYENHTKAYNELSEIETNTFRVSYSSLGSTEFIDCDLENFESFQFNNSRLTEIFISGGSLPENNVTILNTNQNTFDWYDQQVSLCNQFSNVFQRQGHIYEAINYRSKSAHYQMKVLQKKKAYSDLLPFKLNSWSNNHGASWIKALWFILLSASLFYLAALWTTGNLFKFNDDFNSAFIGYFFDFLNPLRPFNYFSAIGLEINGWTRFVDLLSRVVIGYGIYQLIAAFRRYGRK